MAKLRPQPLQAQIKQFFFADGIDTRVNPESLPMGKLHLLQNGKTDRLGVIQKRFGLSLANTEVAFRSPWSPSVLPTMKKFLTINEAIFAIGVNDHVLRAGQTYPSEDRIFSYTDTMGKWPDLSGINAPILQSYPVGSPLYPLGQGVTGDIAYGGGHICVVQYAYLNAGTIQSIVVTLFDETNFESVFSYTISPAVNARVIYSQEQDYFWIFYVDVNTPGNLKADRISPTSNLYGSIGNIITTLYNAGVAANVFYDAVIQTVGGLEKIYIGFKNTTPKVEFRRYTSAMVNDASVISGDAIVPTTCFSMTACSTQAVLAVFSTGANAYACILAATGATISLASFVVTASSQACMYVTDQVVAGGVVIIMQSAAAFTINFRSWHLAAATGGFSLAPIPDNFKIGSRPFTYNGRPHIFLIFDAPNSVQSSFLLYYVGAEGEQTDFNPRPIGRLFYGEVLSDTAIGIPYKQYHPACVALPNSSKFATLSMNVTFDPSSNPAVSYSAPRMVVVDFDDINAYQSITIGERSFHTGGYLQTFDGILDTENQIPFVPDPLVNITTGAGGGMPNNGVYSYCIVLEWTDSKGVQYQSAPSLPVSVTLGAADTKVTFGVQPQGFFYADALKAENASPSQIYYRIYRTLNGGTTYFARSTPAPIWNYYAGFSDTLSDAAIQGNEILYTTGGNLANDAISSVRAVTIWKNRVWCISDNTIFYSKEISGEGAINLSELFAISVEASGGRLTGIAALLDKFIIFKQDRIYYISGDGPNDTGSGSLFPIPQLIAADVGCQSQTSIVETGNSVMFQGRGQYWTIDAGLQVSPLGQELNYFFTESTIVRQAGVFNRDNEIRIQTDNEMFVYNTTSKIWSRHTGLMGGKSFALYNDTPYGIDPAGRVVYENQGSYKDDNDPVELRVITNWIQLGAIEGFQRVWSVSILGRFYSNHTLNVNVYYDYVPQVVDTFSFVADSGNLAAFTDANIFTSSPYSGGGDPYIVKFKLSRQKCTSVRFEIYDSNQSGSCRSLDLISLGLEVAMKDTAPKVPASRSVGAT